MLREGNLLMIGEQRLVGYRARRPWNYRAGQDCRRAIGWVLSGAGVWHVQRRGAKARCKGAGAPLLKLGAWEIVKVHA